MVHAGMPLPLPMASFFPLRIFLMSTIAYGKYYQVRHPCRYEVEKISWPKKKKFPTIAGKIKWPHFYSLTWPQIITLLYSFIIHMSTVWISKTNVRESVGLCSFLEALFPWLFCLLKCLLLHSSGLKILTGRWRHIQSSTLVIFLSLTRQSPLLLRAHMTQLGPYWQYYSNLPIPDTLTLIISAKCFSRLSSLLLCCCD